MFRKIVYEMAGCSKPLPKRKIPHIADATVCAASPYFEMRKSQCQRRGYRLDTSLVVLASLDSPMQSTLNLYFGETRFVRPEMFRPFTALVHFIKPTNEGRAACCLCSTAHLADLASIPVVGFASASVSRAKNLRRWEVYLKICAHSNGISYAYGFRY